MSKHRAAETDSHESPAMTPDRMAAMTGPPEPTCYVCGVKVLLTDQVLDSGRYRHSQCDPPRTEPAAEKKARRGPDVELQAMAKIDGTLASLPSDVQHRVIEWLKGRYLSRHTVYAAEPEGGDKS